jgi:hypothetical protein
MASQWDDLTDKPVWMIREDWRTGRLDILRGTITHDLKETDEVQVAWENDGTSVEHLYDVCLTNAELREQLALAGATYAVAA